LTNTLRLIRACLLSVAATLTIAAVDQTARVHIPTGGGFTLPLNGQRGTSRFRLFVDASDSYAPVTGQRVIWDDNSMTAFEGSIDSIDALPIGDGGGFWYDVACVSLEQLLDKLTVTRAWPAGTKAGDIVKDILSTEAASEGITQGTIANGATFDKPKYYDHARITDAFQDLAKLSGDFIGYILDGAYNFGPRTTAAAPFSASDSDLLILQACDALYSRQDYRNRQTIKIGEQNLSPNIESFPGDGSTASFILSKAIREVVSITRTTSTLPVNGPATGTFTGNPIDGDFVYVGGQKYTFRDGTNPAFNNGTVNFFLGISVLIGATSDDTCANLAAAINAGPGAGTLYGYIGAAVANPNASASASASTITINPLVPGSLSAFFVGLNASSGIPFSWTNFTSTGTDGSVADQSFAEATDPGAKGAQWTYFAGGFTVNQVQGQTILDSSETLVVAYRPLGFGYVTVDDPVEIAARAAAEGGSGVYENVQSRTDLLTLGDGAAAAQALLDSYDFMPVLATFQTDHFGLRPGQIMSGLSMARLGISGDFLVQSVEAAIKGVSLTEQYPLRYTIKAASQAP
jgi:hypothetical protein